MEESKQNANDALTNNSAATKAELLKKYFKEEIMFGHSCISSNIKSVFLLISLPLYKEIYSIIFSALAV